MAKRILAPLLTTLSLSVNLINSATETNLYQLIANDYATNDYFGLSVSISGNTAAIGSPYNDDDGTNSGSVYIFTRDADDESSDWEQYTKLQPSDPGVSNLFGRQVSMYDESLLIIGAPSHDDAGTNAGAAYIFTKDESDNSWSEAAILIGSTSDDADRCGSSVSISSNTAIVGCRKGEKAFIYEYSDENGWEETAELTGSGSGSFGGSVSIYNDLYAMVGEEGAAYVYVKDSSSSKWVEITQLTASDGETSDKFGISVSICNDYAIIGAYNDDSIGSAYIFKKEDDDGAVWTQNEVLTSSSASAGANFGYSVSLNCDANNYYAVIGAYGEGETYVFTLDTTEEDTWIESSVLDWGCNFDSSCAAAWQGISVDVSDNCYIVGVPLLGGRDFGAARVVCEDDTNTPTVTPTPAPTNEQPTNAPTNKPTVPTAAPTSRSCDYTHTCSAKGDPHITTWDGTYYHFQGEGYFDYVKSCNDDLVSLPFLITGKQEYVNDKQSATRLEEIIVSIFDDDNTNNEIRISYPSSGIPTFKDSGESAINSYTLSDDSGSYTVSNKHFEIEFQLPSNVGGGIAKLKFKYSGSTLLFESSGDCLNGIICGLCGDLDDDSSDDFTRCDNLHIIDNTDVDLKQWSSNSNAWLRTHIFGESCCNFAFDYTYLDGVSDCNISNITIPDEPDYECWNEVEEICYSAWDNYCIYCDGDEATDGAVSDEWIENCVFDLCKTCEDNDNINNEWSLLDYDTAVHEGCLEDSINECHVNCDYPSLSPTELPTLSPTPNGYANSNGCEDIDGGGWLLVRHVSSTYGWMHPATDNLAGEGYNTANIDYDAQSGENWSLDFSGMEYNQFLFAFGDCSEWLVASVDSVIGEYYTNEDRCILTSSRSEDNEDSTYTAKWYYRTNAAEDPWISTKDHSDCRDDGGLDDPCMVYGENSGGKANRQYGFETHGGGNVWIRYMEDETRSC